MAERTAKRVGQHPIAVITKANIEAANQAAQAQLDANKVKAEAAATAEKVRVDVLNK